MAPPAEQVRGAAALSPDGRLTVMLAYCAEVRSLSEVKADLFFPKPKIDSEVIEIRFRKTPLHLAPDEAFLFKVTCDFFLSLRAGHSIVITAVDHDAIAFIRFGKRSVLIPA